jgi:AraC-like DNA-binding protein
MALLRYTPHFALQDFISGIILVHHKIDPTGPVAVHPFPPQPGHTLYLFPYDKIICRNNVYHHITELPPYTIVGTQLSRVDLCMGHHMLIVIVSFHPGGLHRLLRLPMHEMVDQYFDASLLLGAEIDQVLLQVRKESDFDKMIVIVEDYFLKKLGRLKSLLPVDRVLMRMVKAKNILSINQLAQQACVSLRQLERQFKERIGISPILFSRLLRFDHARHLREKHPELTWLTVAIMCGYADQMHMIRDFKEFACTSPGLLQKDLERSSWGLLYKAIV